MTSKLLLMAVSAIILVGSVINADRAIAQAKPPDQSQSKPSDKPQAKPSDQSQPTRPRVTFFEQEQKVGKDDSLTFGNENFLQSALAGTTMAIEDPAKLRPNGVTNFNGSNISSGSSISVGTLQASFSSLGDGASFSSNNGSITFGSSSSSSQFTGTVPVNGTINGQSLTGNYNYNILNTAQSNVNSNFRYSTAVQLSNPSQSFVLNVLTQPVETNSGDVANYSAPASVSIGIPRDR
ncbi:MAG: hypothetical protein WCP16_00535 [Pseudanabaena sp. ELA645]|jgi:hypothetical protein